MRFKGTWILLIIAAAAVAYFFLIEQPKHEQTQMNEAAGLRLATFARDSVEHVIIECAGRPTIELEERDGVWNILAPISDGADEAAINILITSISDAEIERRLEPTPELLDECGLNESATRVTLMAAGGDTVFTIIVGNHTLTKSHFYARTDMRPDVLLLPATIRRYAVKELTDFRDKRVVEFNLEDVTKYRLATDAHSFDWELNRDRGWITILDGDTIQGDRQEVETLIQSLRGMRVRSFVSDNARDFDQYWEPPHNTLTFWIDGAAEPLTIRCGRMENGEFFAKRDDQDRIVKLDGIFLASFDKTINDFRDKRLLSFTRDEIATIIFHSPDTSATLVKSGSSWTFPNPSLGTIQESSVTSLLAQLEFLKFDTVVRNEPPRLDQFGFAVPSCRIELLDQEGNHIDEARTGETEPASGARYVTSESSGLLALIDQEKLDALLERFTQLLEP